MRVAIFLSLAFLSITICSFSSDSQIKVKIFLVDASTEEFVFVPIERYVNASVVTPEILIRELLKGPNETERKIGLTCGCWPDSLRPTSQFQGSVPLVTYFLGIEIRNGVAVLNFSKDALRYLNNTSAIQQVVNGCIEKTLIQFPGVNAIDFTIDGNPVEGWDA